MGALLNLFFNPTKNIITNSKTSLFQLLLLGLLGTFNSQPSQAITLHSIYTAACHRDLGLILKVDDHDIQFLSVDGQVHEVPKHEIIYLAYYPSDILPMTEFTNPQTLDYYQIFTSNNQGHLTELVSGWPIGYTEEKIAFLSASGKEAAVSRKNFFQIVRTKKTQPLRFSRPQDYKTFDFVNPYQFRDCPQDRFNKGKIQVFPLQILSQPDIIKKELDHFQIENTRLNRYVREQDFYPIPEVHENQTSLGLWHTFGYRHGGSSKRVSNFTPVLTDSYSSDIFDYQHIFVAGSAPIMTALHEEPQVHSLYAFKASYFHFSAMADPNIMLVGQNYKWQEGDFKHADDRWNSVGQMEMGFDIGNWAFKAFLFDNYQIGMNNEIDTLNTLNIPMFRMGIKYRGLRYGFEISEGGGSKTEDENNITYQTKINGVRINASAYKLWHMDWDVSYINRTIDYESKTFFYQGTSQTLALYGYFPLSSRYRLGGFVSVEDHQNQFTQPSISTGWKEDQATYMKFGTQFSLTF